MEQLNDKKNSLVTISIKEVEQNSNSIVACCKIEIPLSKEQSFAETKKKQRKSLGGSQTSLKDFPRARPRSTSINQVSIKQ